jgi:hypothetical protein
VDVIIGLIGLACLGLVLWDIFETIVVPRPTPSRLRLSRHIVRPAWLAWRAIAAIRDRRSTVAASNRTRTLPVVELA